ncbi:YggS family pyridoxal phosphate-dependent enzyme [Celeribacter sp.]|uniref:YggS family pyridoxal phosphate-dependent enzyme n=1 Tax=Celeribacter sp. TaxID=1890673 RepID=UPI003A916CE2
MGFEQVNARVEAAVEAARRPKGAVQLIAVSKVQPNARVAAVLEKGHRVFGENRVQEAAEKWPGFKMRFPGVELHLIGPLQTNKVRQAMELFDVIQTVDRPKLAKTIARIADEVGHCPRLFVQVNTGEEAQKAGVLPGDADGFITECREMGLTVEGLMCIPPADGDPAPHFAMLAAIAARNGIDAVSMGMSGDFEVAIAAGATHVRVGSAIFGDRDYG